MVLYPKYFGDYNDTGLLLLYIIFICLYIPELVRAIPNEFGRVVGEVLLVYLVVIWLFDNYVRTHICGYQILWIFCLVKFSSQPNTYFHLHFTILNVKLRIFFCIPQIILLTKYHHCRNNVKKRLSCCIWIFKSVPHYPPTSNIME